MKKKTPMYVLAALMWFGFHCGAGFASGAQVKLYVAQYGTIGAIVPVIAWVANCLFMYVGLEYSRLIKAKSYRDVGASIYWDNPVVGKIAIFLWDVLIFMSSISILGSCVAGCGSQMDQLFGLPYWVGCAFFIALMVVILCFGKNILERLGKLSAPLIFMFFAVCIVGIIYGFPHMVEALTTDLGAPIVEDSSFGALFKSGFTYGLVQLGAFQALTVMAGKFESRKETVKFIGLGFVMNCGAMLASFLSLMAFYPDILELALPTLGIIQKLTGPLYVILIIAYNLVLFLAYITTAGGMSCCALVIYLSLLKKKINSDLLCRIIIIVVFFGAATALSTLGLDGILTTVNEINSACRLPVWYIPILILGPFSIHRVVKAQRQKKLAQSDGESG